MVYSAHSFPVESFQRMGSLHRAGGEEAQRHTLWSHHMTRRRDAALNLSVVATWVFLELYGNLIKWLDSWLFKTPVSRGLHAAYQDVLRKLVPAWILCTQEAGAGLIQRWVWWRREGRPLPVLQTWSLTDHMCLQRGNEARTSGGGWLHLNFRKCLAQRARQSIARPFLTYKSITLPSLASCSPSWGGWADRLDSGSRGGVPRAASEARKVWEEAIRQVSDHVKHPLGPQGFAWLLFTLYSRSVGPKLFDYRDSFMLLKIALWSDFGTPPQRAFIYMGYIYFYCIWI